VAALRSQTGTNASDPDNSTSPPVTASVEDIHNRIAQLKASRIANDRDLVSLSATKEQLQKQIATVNESVGKRVKKREAEFVRDQTQSR